jgi:hypothetical protein
MIVGCVFVRSFVLFRQPFPVELFHFNFVDLARRRTYLDVKHDLLEVKHLFDVKHDLLEVKHDLLEVKHLFDVKHDLLDLKRFKLN